MKKQLCLFILLSPFLIIGQVKSDSLFEKYETYDSVTSVLITEHMFALADGFMTTVAENDEDLDPIKGILPKMKSMKILIYDGKDTQAPFYNDIKKSLKKHYKTLMKVKSSDSTIDFLMDGNDKKVKELVFLADNAYIFLQGDLTMDDVNNMVEKMNTNK